mmetsp:Transcript_62274/g.197179  ORF Transcript_62274/g.197179 Transcript_62274/m.197179 type:complete len:340 (+) Transcript_62274:382-1401(+)
MYDSVMDNFISRSARPSRSPRDHRADALVGENLLEEGVGLAAIDDVRGADTLGKGPDAALHLGDHATGEDAVGDELPGARDVGFRDQGANIVLVHEDAGDVRHQHQLLGIQSRGDLPSRSVRVDIEGVAGRVSGNGCNHRDDVLVDQDLDDGWVNGRHLPDVSEVHIARLASAYELPILPAQANSSAALGIDQRDQGLVHVPHEHHLHHLHGRLVRHTQPVLELGLDAKLPQPGVDLRATTVHEHGPDPHERHQDEIAHHPSLQGRVLHCSPAVLDHDSLVVEPLQVGEGLGKHGHPLEGRDAGQIGLGQRVNQGSAADAARLHQGGGRAATGGGARAL